MSHHIPSPLCTCILEPHLSNQIKEREKKNRTPLTISFFFFIITSQGMCTNIFRYVFMLIVYNYKIAQLPEEHVSIDPFFVTIVLDPLRLDFD